jgi:hypothetical protein
MKDVNPSSKDRLHSALLFDAPTNIERGDSFRKTRMLYTISEDEAASKAWRAVYCSLDDSLVFKDIS